MTEEGKLGLAIIAIQQGTVGALFRELEAEYPDIKKSETYEQVEPFLAVTCLEDLSPPAQLNINLMVAIIQNPEMAPVFEALLGLRNPAD